MSRHPVSRVGPRRCACAVTLVDATPGPPFDLACPRQAYCIATPGGAFHASARATPGDRSSPRQSRGVAVPRRPRAELRCCAGPPS
eukprot:469432-Alexandrium_andersonii.AAC.1